MKLEDSEIGHPIAMGMRLGLGSEVSLLLDSKIRFEVIVLELDSTKQVTMLSGESGSFEIIRRGSTNAAIFNLAALNQESRYLVGIYAPYGVLENVLLTVSNPRSHVILSGEDAAGMVVGMLYKKLEEWKFKLEGSVYKEGLPAIMQAYLT